MAYQHSDKLHGYMYIVLYRLQMVYRVMQRYTQWVEMKHICIYGNEQHKFRMFHMIVNKSIAKICAQRMCTERIRTIAIIVYDIVGYIHVCM